MIPTINSDSLPLLLTFSPAESPPLSSLLPSLSAHSRSLLPLSSKLKPTSANRITARTLSLLKSNKAALFSALDLTMEYGEDVTLFHSNLAAAAVLAEAVISRAGNTLLDKLVHGERSFFKNGRLVEKVEEVKINTVQSLMVSAIMHACMHYGHGVETGLGGFFP